MGSHGRAALDCLRERDKRRVVNHIPEVQRDTSAGQVTKV